MVFYPMLYFNENCQVLVKVRLTNDKINNKIVNIYTFTITFTNFINPQALVVPLMYPCTTASGL